MLFKIVVWPFDLKNFSGQCSLRKAFPDYQQMEVELQFKRVEREAQESRSYQLQSQGSDSQPVEPEQVNGLEGLHEILP